MILGLTTLSFLIASSMAETVKVETPDVPKPNVPKVSAPKVEAPKVDAPKVETPSIPHLDGTSGESKSTGIAGPFLFGPQLSVLLFPSVGIDTKLYKVVGLSFEYAYIPTIQIPTYGVGVGYNNVSLKLKAYPFRGAFYLGVAYGIRNLVGSKTDSLSVSGVSTSVTVSSSVRTLYWGPHLGWKWVRASGFFMGMELGVELPISVSTATPTTSPAIDSSTPGFSNLQSQVTSGVTTLGNQLGNIPFPMVTLLQFGYLF